VLTADTTVTWSLSGGSNSDYRLTKAACWPLSLNRHELGKRDSDAHLVASKARRLPVTPFPIGAPAECHPRLPFLQGTSGRWTRGRGVPGGIRTRNLQALDLAPLPVGLQAHGAAIRCRPGSPALRGRGRSRARRHDVAPGAGVEPTLTASEAGVLPLDDPGSVRKVRFERTCREV
jgi:hypothetical protein